MERRRLGFSTQKAAEGGSGGKEGEGIGGEGERFHEGAGTGDPEPFRPLSILAANEVQHVTPHEHLDAV